MTKQFSVKLSKFILLTGCPCQSVSNPWTKWFWAILSAICRCMHYSFCRLQQMQLSLKKCCVSFMIMPNGLLMTLKTCCLRHLSEIGTVILALMQFWTSVSNGPQTWTLIARSFFLQVLQLNCLFGVLNSRLKCFVYILEALRWYLRSEVSCRHLTALLACESPSTVRVYCSHIW